MIRERVFRSFHSIRLPLSIPSRSNPERRTELMLRSRISVHSLIGARTGAPASALVTFQREQLHVAVPLRSDVGSWEDTYVSYASAFKTRRDSLA